MSTIIMTKDLRTYQAPKIKNLKSGYYVEYYYISSEGERVRKRVYFNRIKGKERTTMANKLVKELTIKLEQGWTPELYQESKSSLRTVNEALEVFIKDKSGYYRADSERSLISKCKFIKKYCAAQGLFNCIQITQQVAIDMSKHVARKGYKSYTYNNYVRWFILFGNWCVSNGFMNANPWQGIKKRPSEQKSREPLPPHILEAVLNYFKARDKRMYAICLLMLKCGLRGKEVLGLQRENFDLKKSTIYKASGVSKNKQANVHTIPESIKPLLRQVLDSTTPGHYVFSQKLRSGTRKKDTRYINHWWTAMRTALNLDAKYQMYSLRDTGIIDLLNKGISIERVAKQFHHGNLQITSMYAIHANAAADDKIKAL